MLRSPMAAKLLVVNTFVWAVAAIYMPYISAFYTLRGIPANQIGVLLAVGPITSLCVQPLWARLSDKINKRRSILICISMGGGLSMLLFMLGGTFLQYLCIALITSAFTTAIVPMSDALITKIAGEQHLNFATIRIGGTLGFALMVLAAGPLFLENPSHLFPLGFVTYQVLAAVCLLLPRDPKMPLGGATRVPAASKSSSHRIFTSDLVKPVMVFAFAVQFGMSFYSGFMGVYTIHLQFDQSVIGLFFCISALSEIPALLVAKKLVARFGTVRILLFSACMMALRIAMVASEQFPWMVLSQLMQSVTYMTSYYCCVTFVSRHVHRDKISLGQSILSMVQSGAASVAGNLLGGLLVGRYGVRQAFLLFPFIIVILVLANLLIMAFIRSKGSRA